MDAGSTVGELASLAYRAAVNPAGWQIFCDSLARATRTRVAMHGRDQVSGLTFGVLNANYDPAYIGTYIAHYGGVSPWMSAITTVPVGVVQRSEAIVPFDELVRTELYNDWAEPQDIATGAGVTLFRDETRLFRLSCNMSLRDREAHQDQLVQLLQALVPHLTQSVMLARRLAGIPVALPLQEALEIPPQAIFLLDRIGRVAHVNKHGIGLLSAGEHVEQDRQGRLKLADPDAARTVAGFLRGASGGVAGSVTLRSSGHSSITRGTIAPFDATSLSIPYFMELIYERRPVAILCVDLPQLSPAALTARLTSEFGLTTAEAEVAGLLQDGNRPRTIAHRRGTSIQTVRNQLKVAFSKLGVSKQHELVSMLRRLSHT